MIKPLEVIHQNVESKLDVLRKICQHVNVATGPVDDIARDYNEQTISVLCDYYLEGDLKAKCSIVSRYMQIVIGRNFVSRMNMVEQQLDNPRNNDDAYLSTLFKTYRNTQVDTNVDRIDYKSCPNCAGRMYINEPRSELHCTKCDYTVELKGMMYDESHMFNNDGSLAKRGSYETSRHCRYHLERILAIKNPNLPDHLVGPGGKIDRWLERNGYRYLKLVSCREYRRCLKEIGETKFNEHVPFIRQVKSGVSPDRLFHHEMRRLYIYFEKVVTEFNRINSDERANLKYYPYFIFKIIEIILDRPADRKRLQSIVNCIHFQRDDTVAENDRLWRKICDGIPEFSDRFSITDRNLIHD